MTSKKQPNILSFFKPQKVDNIQNNTDSVVSGSDTDIPTSSTSHINRHDIFNYVKRVLTQNEIHDILNAIWIPDVNYNFPVKIFIVGKDKTARHLKFQYKWFASFSWLVYSDIDNGAYCKFCVAFSTNYTGINNQTLGSLVTKKYDNWRHALEYFKNHSQLEYHKKCILDSENFLNIIKNPTLSVDKQIDIGRKKEIIQNRKNIIPVIEAIILCGRQNMALRGHRDSGNIFKACSDDKQNNDGNFRAILRYRAQGDSDMRSYLESSGTIKYTSSTSQNEIIDSCNKLLLNKIVSRVNEVKCFSVLADETADVSGIEQVSLCVRYVELSTLELHEDFLQFVPAVDMTGKGLAKLIIDNLQNFGIDTTYLRGQGYDGAASMSGKFNGVQAHIKDTHPLAIYVHCSAHVLNLVVSKSCSATQIRDCLATLGKVRDFFIFPKRKSILQFHIENSSATSTKKSLKRSCETRWIERFHAINDFMELYEYVIEALDTISEWDDNNTSNKARRLRSSILDIEFVISLFVLNKGFSIGLPLSKFLQKSNIDLKLAVQLANDTQKELQELRTHADDVFKEIFEEVKVVAEKFDIEIKIPRLTKKQTNRCNIPLNTPEQYYRASIFIPYLDKFITELEEKFNVHRSILSGFDSLFRKNGPIEDILILSNKYIEDLQNDGSQNQIIEAEYKLWQRKLMQTTEKPNNALEAMAMCNQSIYPNIFKLLQILVTLPVSSATNERTFSNLKRIKTYLRNSMSEVNYYKLKKYSCYLQITIKHFVYFFVYRED